MTRAEILDKAKAVVTGQREQDYGSPESNFGLIGQLWTVYLNHLVTAQDVANMMCLFKIARIRTGRGTADSYIDAVGYMACGGEIATADEKSNADEIAAVMAENEKKRELLRAIFGSADETETEADSIADIVKELREIGNNLYRVAYDLEEDEDE